jgi:tRNA1(Val) A37 N6-methylase TrmN6
MKVKAFRLREGERLDDLQAGGLSIIQSDEVFSFSLDAVLLARYVTVRNKDRVLDLGTGNGVIPLLLTTRRPDPRAEIVGLELQERLAEMARRSVEGNGLTEQVRIVQGDLREAKKLFEQESFDVVTCNPPYRPAGIGDPSQNPYVRIAKHEVTATLEDVVLAASRMCRYQGKFAMVHRPDRLAEIMAALKRHQFEPKRMLLVHPKATSRPNMVLIESIKGGRPELRIDPPLIVHREDGTYTQAVEDLYAGRYDWSS